MLTEIFGGNSKGLRAFAGCLGGLPGRFGGSAGTLGGYTGGLRTFARGLGGGTGVFGGYAGILGLHAGGFRRFDGGFRLQGGIGCGLASGENLVHYGGIYLLHLDTYLNIILGHHRAA